MPRIITFLLLVLGTIFLGLYAFRVNFENWNTLGLGLFCWILVALIGAVPVSYNSGRPENPTS